MIRLELVTDLEEKVDGNCCPRPHHLLMGGERCTCCDYIAPEPTQEPIPSTLKSGRVEVKLNREAIGTLDSTPRARLDVVILLDGQEMGHHVILSGPAKDVDAYMAGQMTLAELQRSWLSRQVW